MIVEEFMGAQTLNQYLWSDLCKERCRKLREAMAGGAVFSDEESAAFLCLPLAFIKDTPGGDRRPIEPWARNGTHAEF
jgi:hypothetical protein